MSSHTSSRQEEYNSSYIVYHHSLNTRVIIKQIGLKTDTISNLAPKIYRQAMKSAESAEWQEAIDAELQSMQTNDV